MSAEEFDARPGERWVEGHRYEVINGVLIVTPPPACAERDANDDLGYLLRSYQETHPEGSALDATLPEHTVPCTPNRRRCDRAIWAGLGRQPDELADVPTIVVEFVSRSRRDRERDYDKKVEEYRLAGVGEYWIIDRFDRVLIVHRFGPAQQAHREVPGTGTYQTDLLPGFVLPLSRLLARSDLWPKNRQKLPRRLPPASGQGTP